jgi:hypothetical protein
LAKAAHPVRLKPAFSPEMAKRPEKIEHSGSKQGSETICFEPELPDTQTSALKGAVEFSKRRKY